MKNYINDDKLKGAWILNLGKKLNILQNTMLFDGLLDTSKIGLLLQVITANDIENSLSFDEIKIKAKSIGINSPRELKIILKELKSLKLIDYDENLKEIVVLGLTNDGILKHTTSYFNEYAKDDSSEIIINVSEKITNMPERIGEIADEFSDIFKLKREEIEKYLNIAVKYELLDSDEQQGYLYNSNIFRFDEVRKIQKILDNLTPDEKEEFLKLSNELKEKNVLDYDYCKSKYDPDLLSKLIKVNIIDANIVNSPYGEAIFLTLPSSFKKFSDSNALIDDVMDFAKAFLSSIYYGMSKSKHSRGKLDTYYFVLKKLINGDEIGCATAICEDYRYLEIKGVLKVRKCPNFGCKMRLLKKEVGEIVFKLLEDGIIFDEFEKQDQSFDTKIFDYESPDVVKKKIASNETLVTDILEIVRTN